MNEHMDSTTRLRTHLDRIAQLLSELGTQTETRCLAELAQTIRDIAPGAASALTDRDASEISRLRATESSRTIMKMPSPTITEMLTAVSRFCT